MGRSSHTALCPVGEVKADPHPPKVGVGGWLSFQHRHKENRRQGTYLLFILAFTHSHPMSAAYRKCVACVFQNVYQTGVRDMFSARFVVSVLDLIYRIVSRTSV